MHVAKLGTQRSDKRIDVRRSAFRRRKPIKRCVNNRNTGLKRIQFGSQLFGSYTSHDAGYLTTQHSRWCNNSVSHLTLNSVCAGHCRQMPASDISMILSARLCGDSLLAGKKLSHPLIATFSSERQITFS